MSFLSRMLAFLVFCLASMLGSVEAGMIIATGDNSIDEGLAKTIGIVPPTAGNQMFFMNALGGGTSVKVLDTVGGDTFSPSGTNVLNVNAVINNFYNGVGGVTSSIISGPITSASLSGTSLFIADLPTVAFTSAEIAALNGFLATGGHVLLLGEGYRDYPAEDLVINADLKGLGSVMSLTAVTIDNPLHYATTADGQILADPLSAGITSLGYSYTTGVTGGSAVFLNSDLKTAFVAEQVTPNAIPEPRSAALAVLGIGLTLVARSIRRPVDRSDSTRPFSR